MLNLNDLSHKMKGKVMCKELWLEKCHLYTHQVFPMTKVQWFLNRKHTRVYPEFHPHPLLGESMWKGDTCCVHRKHSFTPRPKPLCSSPLHTLTPTSASKLSTAVTTPDTVSLGKGRLVLTQGFRSLRSRCLQCGTIIMKGRLSDRSQETTGNRGQPPCTPFKAASITPSPIYH